MVLNSIQDWQRFWAKVEKTTTCWNWMAGRHRGYGRFKLAGKCMEAHRISYRSCIGEIPADKVIDHLCRNRRCVNPSHMEIVTNRVNILRGVGRGAIAARMTHCMKGHVLAGPNLVQTRLRSGHRACKICYNVYHNKWAKDKKRWA